MLLDKDKHIKPFSQFVKDTMPLNDKYNRHYLKAEYLFAVHSAQSVALWEDYQKNSDRYYLQYQTAGDERVRASHASLDGITLPADDAFWHEYFPPNGWRCRCTTAQCRKQEASPSSSSQTLRAGEKATTQINKAGKNPLAIFRFNPGIEHKIFPPRHPYYKAADKETKRQIKKVQKQAEPETFSTIPTEKGKVLLSSRQNYQERQENIDIATYLANKYNYSIKLLGILRDQKTPDSFNETLKISQEYKVSKANTLNSLDRLLRSGFHQSPNVVLKIDSALSKDELFRQIYKRMDRSKDAKSVLLIFNGEDYILRRE